MKNWPFPVLWPPLSFPSLLAYWVHTLTASSFRIWNSSGKVPSPPLALSIGMLSKAHLTSHSRMSGSRWVTTPSWLSRSLRPFLYSFSLYFCVYSCHLLTSSESVRFLTISAFYCAHLCMKCSPGISSFLEEISSLSYSIFTFWWASILFIIVTAEIYISTSSVGGFPFLHTLQKLMNILKVWDGTSL